MIIFDQLERDQIRDECSHGDDPRGENKEAIQFWTEERGTEGKYHSYKSIHRYEHKALNWHSRVAFIVALKFVDISKTRSSVTVKVKYYLMEVTNTSICITACCGSDVKIWIFYFDDSHWNQLFEVFIWVCCHRSRNFVYIFQFIAVFKIAVGNYGGAGKKEKSRRKFHSFLRYHPLIRYQSTGHFYDKIKAL